MNKDKKRTNAKESTANSSVRKKESGLWERIMAPITGTVGANAVWQEIGDAMFRRGKYGGSKSFEEVLQEDPLKFFELYKDKYKSNIFNAQTKYEEEHRDFDEMMRRRKERIRETEYKPEQREILEERLRALSRDIDELINERDQKVEQIRKRYSGKEREQRIAKIMQEYNRYIEKKRQVIREYLDMREKNPDVQWGDRRGTRWSSFEDWYEEQYGKKDRETRRKAYETIKNKHWW